MAQPCWLKDDNPYGTSYDRWGKKCDEVTSTDRAIAVAVVCCLLAVLLMLLIGWIIRYSVYRSRFNRFWNQIPPSEDDAESHELAEPKDVPSLYGASMSSASLNRLSYIPSATSRPRSMSIADSSPSYSRPSSIHSSQQGADTLNTPQKPRIRRSPLSSATGQEDTHAAYKGEPLSNEWGAYAQGGIHSPTSPSTGFGPHDSASGSPQHGWLGVSGRQDSQESIGSAGYYHPSSPGPTSSFLPQATEGYELPTESASLPVNTNGLPNFSLPHARPSDSEDFPSRLGGPERA